MAKNIQQKQGLIDNYKGILNKASAMYMFTGSLNAKQTQELKNQLGGSSKLTLLKNTLFNKAASELGMELNAEGYNNMIYTEKDLIGTASALSKFLNDNKFDATKVVVGRNIYDGAKLKQISGLGSEVQVQSKLVGVLAMPTTMLVRGLQSPMQKLVYTLSQIKK